MELVNFFLHHWLLSLAFISVLTSLLYLEISKKRQGIKALPLSEMVNLVNHQGAMLIDIRPLALYQQGHILGARHALLTAPNPDVTALPTNKDTALIIIDTNGAGSQPVGILLKQHGFKNIYSLQGGMLNWQNANMPTVKEA